MSSQSWWSYPFKAGQASHGTFPVWRWSVRVALLTWLGERIRKQQTVQLNKNSAALTERQERKGILDDYSLTFITSLLRVQQVADNMPFVPSQLWSRHVFRPKPVFLYEFWMMGTDPSWVKGMPKIWDKSVDGSCIFQDLGCMNTGKSINTNWIMSWGRLLSPKWLHFNYFG